MFKNTGGPESERIKKNLQSLFKKYGLEILIECNKKVGDYLDVTFNLKDGTYKPYHKPDNKTSYINVQSSRTPNINNYQKQHNNDYPTTPLMKQYSTKLPHCTKKDFLKQLTMPN